MGRASRKGGVSVGGAVARTRGVQDSPWGEPDQVETIAPGVYWVDTPGHGGIMIERQIGDEILSPSEKETGLANNPMSGQWYAFEEDVDWTQAVNALRRQDIDHGPGRGSETQIFELPASEIMPGDAVYPPDPYGDAPYDGLMIVEDKEERPDGTYFHSAEGGGYLLPSGETLRTERVVMPRWIPPQLQRVAAAGTSAADRAMANHVDAADQVEDQFGRGPTLAEQERMIEEDHRARAAARAEDDAEDEGLDWSTLSESEQTERIKKASETLSDEDVARAERQADAWG